MNVEGYQCQMGAGSLYYAKVPIYDVFNTDFYYLIPDVNERRGVIERLLSETAIIPQIKIKAGGDRTVLFARTNFSEDELWITVKTSRHDGFRGQIQWSKAQTRRDYLITDVFGGQVMELSGSQLITDGFPAVLGDSDSNVYFVKPKMLTKTNR